MEKRYITTLGIIVSIVCLLMLGSCEKDPWVWDTGQKNGISMYRDSVDLSFEEYNDSTWANVRMYYNLIGMPKDYDRKILFEVVDSLTNVPAEDFKILGDTVRAGQVDGDISFWTKRPKYHNQENGELYFTVQVTENEHFIPMMTSRICVSIFVFYPGEQPAWWDETIFGVYSVLAYQKYMQYYNRLATEHELEWNSIFKNVYGVQMKSMGEKWEGVYLTFLPMIKSFVLEPMFDYYVRNPNPEIDIPEWYKELEK